MLAPPLLLAVLVLVGCGTAATSHADEGSGFVVLSGVRPGCGHPIKRWDGGRVYSRAHAQRACDDEPSCVAYEWSGAEGAQLEGASVPNSIWLCAVPAVAIPDGLSQVRSYFLVFVPTIREIRDFYREM
eukprot:SAG31_NODE_10230_length_1167_cov_1.357678_2_plen_129_part_00